MVLRRLFVDHKRVSNPNGFELVEVNLIIRIEANDNYTKVYIHGEPILYVSKSLKALEDQLQKPRFLRINRSNIINMTFLKQWIKESNWEAVMEDGFCATISRRKKTEFIEVLSEWVMGGEVITEQAAGLLGG